MIGATPLERNSIFCQWAIKAWRPDKGPSRGAPGSTMLNMRHLSSETALYFSGPSGLGAQKRAQASVPRLMHGHRRPNARPIQRENSDSCRINNIVTQIPGPRTPRHKMQDQRPRNWKNTRGHSMLVPWGPEGEGNKTQSTRNKQHE